MRIDNGKRYCALVVAVLTILLVSKQVQALSRAEKDKLMAAEKVAERVLDKTGNAEGAAKVMEEAGIGLLIKGDARSLADPDSLRLLEKYADFVARVPGRQDEAAGYLKSILKQDASRLSAYRNLGELYYQRYLKQPDQQYQRIYEQAYKKYVQLLIEQNISLVLPEHIVQAVYGDAADVCGLLREATRQNRVLELRRFLSPEQDVDAAAKLDAELGVSLEGLFQTAVGPVRQADIDIDNDGELERRYTAKVENGCRRNLFYKPTAGRYSYLGNSLMDQYYKPDRICGSSALFPVRYKKKNYLVEQQMAGTEQKSLQVYEIPAAGEPQQLCQLASQSVLQANLVRSCDAPVCLQLAAKIDRLVAADAQIGNEWLVTDITTLPYADKIKADTHLAPYLSSQHQYLADLDNDGKQELIARLWQQAGDGLHYSYRLFKSVDDQWQRWDWPAAATATVVPGIPDNIWFFVEPFTGVNYLVSYAVIQTETTMQYTLRVYNIDADGMHYQGEMRTFANRQ